MIGKPPYRDLKDLGVDWELPEGRLSLSALSDKNSPVADDKGKVWFISYELRSSKDIPFPVVNSIEDMAALVNIDLQGRKPDGYSSSRGAYYYRDVSVNGKKVGIDFSALDGKIRGVTVSRE